MHCWRLPKLRTILRFVFLSLALGGAQQHVEAAEHLIRAMPNNTFEPSFLEVELGDTVTWQNDGGFHNVVSPGRFRCANGCDDLGGNGDPAANAWSFSQTFSSPDTVDFLCEPHEAIGMVGTVVVGDGGSNLGFTLEGQCPGSVDLAVTGAQPLGPVALLFGTDEGSDPLKGGPCAGVTTGLENPTLLGVFVADSSGSLNLSRTVSQAACGRPIVAIDAQCKTSNVVTLPDVAAGAIELQPLATGLEQPNTIAHAGDGSGRLFIVSQPGQIFIWDGSQILATPFLDIRDRVQWSEKRLEQGLVGLAFDPEYTTNGRFFVSYSDLAGDSVVTSFEVGADPDQADPTSESLILLTPQPDLAHNVGQLNFGPDGFLYIGSGDGGCCDDPFGTGQDPQTFLGKILRVDVSGASGYTIPPDNPFVGLPGVREEIWAYGLRNPWRLSFDRLTGDLFIADVGQDLWEEVNFEAAGDPGGKNYGWSLMEGSQCFNPPTDCNDGSLSLPILEYPHFDQEFVGCAVVGGHRYRGKEDPALEGIYLYGDFCTGTLWGANDDSGSWTSVVLLETDLLVSSFGEDEQGELYVVDWAGVLYRIRAAASARPSSLEVFQTK